MLVELYHLSKYLWATPDIVVHPNLTPLSLFTLQSEEKIKAVPSLYGPLMTLNHMVQQDYFPKSLVPVLLAFVTK